jgi:hypothetical protein
MVVTESTDYISCTSAELDICSGQIAGYPGENMKYIMIDALLHAMKDWLGIFT